MQLQKKSQKSVVIITKALLYRPFGKAYWKGMTPSLAVLPAFTLIV
jgi:hypothetical protein